MSKVKRPSLYHIVVIFLITLACQPVNDQLLQGTQVAEEPGVSIPTVTPTPCVGCSRALPIDAGQVAQTKHWQVQVLETLPGEEAWETLYEANYFNDPSPPAKGYALYYLLH